MDIRLSQSIEDVPSHSWQRMVPSDFPFLDYHFLRALETTDCLGKRTGWEPLYLTAWKGDKVSGALIAYLKNNSYGEYIFDFAWAQAFESAGIDYYPKIISAIPFTPATGPKMLFNPELDPSDRLTLSNLLLGALTQLGAQLQTSSIHSLFIPAEDLSLYEKSGFFIRHSYQYHWSNKNYSSFDDFAQTLRSKRRRELRQERAKIIESGIQITRLAGSQLTREHADLFYRFYSDTIEKHGGYDYLTREFFREVFDRLPDRLLFVLATDSAGLPVAGALNYWGDRTLYGRHWGCLANYKFLHFELCYYQGIEFAIEKNLRLFEAGAQGEHKFQRGFLPNLTYSAHEICNPRLDFPIRNFVDREKLQIAAQFREYAEHSPFSRTPAAAASASTVAPELASDQNTIPTRSKAPN